MRKSVFVLAISTLLLASCGTFSSALDRIDTVSVKFDPHDYDIEDLRSTAQAECQAKNPKSTAFKDEDKTIENTGSVKWSYMTFGCYL